MQREWIVLLTIWGCEIDSNLKTDLASSENVVEEGFLLFNLNLFDGEGPFIILDSQVLARLCIFLNLREIYWPSLDFRVFSRRRELPSGE